MKILKACPGQEIVLGHRGENSALKIVFDLTPWVETYGFGTAHLLHQRDGDAEPYPVATVQDDHTLSWEVTDADTAISGYGKYELHYYVGEALAKSSTGETYTRAALAYGTEAPDPIKGWVDYALEVTNSVFESAREAAASAQAADQSAGNAAASEQVALTAQTAAEEAARKAALSEQNAGNSEQNAKQSETNAQQSAKDAAQSATEAAALEAATKALKESVERTHDSVVTYHNAVANNANYAESLKDQTVTAANNAKSSEQSASTYAGNAKTSEANAKASEERASASATSAEKSAEEAKKAAKEAKGIAVTAKPGQLIRVKEVDEDGNPTKWEAAPWMWTEQVEGDEIFPETAIGTHTSAGAEQLDGDEAVPLVAGEKYIVYCNGTPYECTAKETELTDGDLTGSVVSLGNHAILDEVKTTSVDAITDRTNTGEPFVVVTLYLDGHGMYVGFLMRGAEPAGEIVSLRIHSFTEIVHTLPGKFLPDGVPYSEGGMVEILPECQPTYDESEGIFLLTENFPALVIGETYTVNWNGVKYTGTAFDGSAEFAAGVVILVNDGADLDTGEGAVYMIAYSPGEGLIIISIDGSTELTISIYGSSETIHKLENKYLSLDWLPITKVNTIFEETMVENGGTLNGCGYGDYRPGTNFTVIMDGVQYPVTVKEGNGQEFFGNVAVFAPDTTGTENDTGEPFVAIMTYSLAKIAFADGTAHKVAIISEPTPDKMPEEFLPESVESVILRSSTADSTKLFKLTIDDSGTITATEVT